MCLHDGIWKGKKALDQVVTPRPSAANLALRAVSRVVASVCVPPTFGVAAKEAPSCVLEEDVGRDDHRAGGERVCETALVVTSAAFARTVLIAVCAAAS